jgi:hypothetical protein
VLAILIEHPELYAFAHDISDLLERGAREDREGSIPMVHLPLAEALAERFWVTIDGRPTGEAQDDPERWTGESINHPGGKLTEFWLFALSRRRAEAGEEWGAYRRGTDGI